MACTALAVDGEVMPDKVFKRCTVEGNELHVCVWTCAPVLSIPLTCAFRRRIAASEVKFLRTVLSVTHDMLGVAVRTLQEFA